jgi:hypothetical protein
MCSRRGVVRPIGCLAAVLSLFTPGAPVCADVKFVETHELRIVYFDPTGAYLVPYAAQCLINSLAAQHEHFGYTPDGKVTVLLQDFADRGNAAVVAAPRNRVFLDIAPMTLAFESFSPGERTVTLANHELVHLVTTDMANGQDRRYRRLFGGKVMPVAEHPESILYQYLTVPRVASPRWFQEGSAVFMETWLGGGLGRAQGGYDEMVFRAMVRDGADFYDPLALVSKGTEVDFQAVGNAYLYGTRFMSYLGLQYGPDLLLEWWARPDGSARYYAVEFERLFGRPLDQAWGEWIQWEQGFQQRNLASVREHPITQPRDVARHGLGAISRTFVSSDRRTIFAAVRYPGRVPHLVAISLADGAVTELQEVQGAVPYRVSSLAYDPASETLFYTTDNQTYRNLMAYDLRAKKSRQLLKAARIGDLAFNPADRSLWGLRTNNGFVVLVRIPYPYTEWHPVHVFPYAEVAFDLDISPDGSLLSTSVAGPDEAGQGTQVMQVRVMRTDELLAGNAAPLRRIEFGTAVPEGFTFSPDGRYLFGSAYYTGVSNIYRYEIATGRLDAMSNAEIGFFRPIELDPTTLLVFHYTAGGFVPATIPAIPTEDLSAITFLGEQIATRQPVVQGWVTGPPSDVDYDAAVLDRGEYRAARDLSLESIYPVVEGYKDSVGFGLHARFSDPVGFDAANLTATYSADDALPGKERLHLLAEARHAFWNTALKWNAGDFYDLFGPTKRSREGYSVHVGYERPLLFNPPETLRVTAKAAYYGDLDALPAFQNVPATSDRLADASVGLAYENLRGSVGKVDAEAGHAWEIGAHAYQSEGDFIPSVLGRFDVGVPLPLNHSSIWWRNGAGISSGDRDNPLTSAYFGGFGNNYVDDGEAKRYRDLFRMPGFEIDALSGKAFVKSMVEWNLPPLRFESAGSPGFYASWARPALFATALVTDPHDGDYREDAYNAGVQVDIQLQVMHRLPMMLSFGYAAGFAAGGKGEGEFMLSLKVL